MIPSPSTHRHCRALLPLFAATLFCVVPASAGCGEPPTAAPPARTALVPSVTRAGVTYDPAPPLEAVTKTAYDTTHPPAVLTYSVRFKGAGGQIVPGLFVVPADAAKNPKPTVLLLHGLGGNKSQLYLSAVSLAGQGFCALSIDAAGHGERALINNKPLSQLGVEETHVLAGQTIADLRRAVDFLQSRPEVDRAKIGFMGVSLGGILGAVFASDEPRIKATVLWAAGGDWGKLLTTTAHPFASRYRTVGAAKAADLERIMADVDPLTTITTLSPRPLLMINGDKDTVVPVDCTNALYAACHEPKERIVLPGGHIPDVVTMQERSARWFKLKLGGIYPAAAAALPAAKP